MDVFADGGIPGGSALAQGDAALGTGLALLIDELAHGMLVATVEGRLLHANQAARNELARRRVLGARQSLLYACAPEGGKLLQEALGKVAEGKRSLVTLAAAQGASLTLAVVPLKALGQPPKAALLFARASVCDTLMLGFFARSHGLTATE